MIDEVEGDVFYCVFWVLAVNSAASGEDVYSGDDVFPAIRAESGGIGAAEYHDDWGSEGCGDVPGAGIVAYNQSGGSH